MEDEGLKTKTSNTPSLKSHLRLRPCLNCGEQIERDYVYCWNCGAKRGAIQFSNKAEGKKHKDAKKLVDGKLLIKEKPNMNARQRKIIFIGLMIIAVMLLWPPWKVGNLGRSIGYHLFFRSNPAGYAGAYLDWSRLGLQGLIVAVLIAAVIIFVGNKDETRG